MNLKTFTKTIIISLSVLLLMQAANELMAQAPQIKWAKSYGGSATDKAYDINNTNDGGHIICGATTSNDGDISENKGGTDAWVVKTNGDGDIIWQKTYGGSGDDWFKSIIPLVAGGYIACGSTNSVDGDVEVNHGASDFWVVKLDNSGNIIWEETYGGSFDDLANDISSSADTGFLAVGYTFSPDGQISEYKDNGDGWLVFINADGDLLKQKTKGGKEFDEFYSVSGTANGGFILAGKTFSSNGTVSGNHGGSDAWIARLSKQGTEQWNVLFGDTGNDGALDAKENADGNFVVSGWFDNGVSFDSWIYETNNSGSFITGTYHGGTGNEFAGSLLINSVSNYTMAASSESEVSGDKDCHLGGKDFWLHNVDINGTVNWQKCMGGTNEDHASRALGVSDGTLVICGYSNSTDLDVTGNHGDFDFWVVKLVEGCEVNAAFSATISGPSASFTNNSFDATTFHWDFGDGNTSTAINPSHIYSDEGTYTVCLIATSACTSDTICSDITITCVPVNGEFNYSANFTSVSFTSTDISAATWLWTFGDGGTSTLQNPTHNYLLNGDYEVCLTTTNFCSDATSCQTITVVCQNVEANFTYVINGTTVSFTNTSTGATSYKWKFGDSFNTNQQNPTHTYADTGTYTVCLTAISSCMNDTLCIDIHVGCEPTITDFSTSGTELSVSFTDLSSNANSWSWTFGDGGTSNIQDPIHVYDAPGTYEVCLTTSNECSSSSYCMNVVANCPAISADFMVSISGNMVDFTDQSAGATSWNWNFGDGASSTLQSPSHIYSSPGTYNVCLTSKNVCAEAVSCKEIVIECPALTASFEYSADEQTLILNDLSSGATGWNWTFGDGNSSTQQNPTHIYANGGTYEVCLTTSNGCDSKTVCTSVQLQCLPFSAAFTFDQDANTVQFTDASGSAVSWSWDFGDGGTSTLQNPEHVYSTNGIYEVCLTAGDGCSSSQICETVVIIGVYAGVISRASEALEVYPNPLNDNGVVVFDISESSMVELKLFNVEGKEEKELFNGVLYKGKYTIPFTVSNLAAGSYLLRFISASEVVVKHLVIE